MTSREDTKQAFWFLLLIIQTITLGLAGWNLSRTVESGERIARLEAKIDFLTGNPRVAATVAPKDSSRSEVN